MVWKIVLAVIILIVLMGIIGTLLYNPVIRPWHARWGASDEEVSMALPGDEIVTGKVVQTTRAIDIHAPAARTWPWLLQIGQGRGGMFSYDWLENLVGCDIHTLDAIVPELQTLKVGDVIKIGPQQGLPYYKVVQIEPNRALVIRAMTYDTGIPGGTWGFYLVEKGSGLTRLVIRHRDPESQDSTEKTVNTVMEPISFVMERKMLYGLRDHAEK